MRTRLAWLSLTLALGAACKRAGDTPPPTQPTYRLVYPSPCLTQPPVDPGPVLLSAPACEGSGESLVCPPLSTTEIDAVWSYIEALQGYAARAWRCEQKRARRQGGEVPGGSGKGEDAGPPRP